MLNTKLAVEYERQWNKKFPGAKTFVGTEPNGDICFEFEFPTELLGNKTIINCTLNYKSQKYTNDIECTIYYNCTTAQYLKDTFVESHKTLEMNVNNLIVCLNKLKNVTLQYNKLYNNFKSDYNKYYSNILDEDITDIINWGKSHKIDYQGISDKFEKDYDTPEHREELKKAIAILKTIEKYNVCKNEHKFEDSYSLKHRFEDVSEKLLGKMDYFSTGTGVLAAYGAYRYYGNYTSEIFDLKPCKPNFDFNISNFAYDFLYIVNRN